MAKLCSIAAVLVLCVCTAHARVWYVAADGAGTGTGWGDALPGVGAALAAAASGDEVWVKGATYEERIFLKDGVALYGGFAGDEDSREQRDWAANPTVIDASRSGSVVTCEDVALATLDGFTLTGGIAYRGGGVYCWSSSPTLTNCTITWNTAFYEGGGMYSDGSSSILTNCTITGNTAYNYGGGMRCDRGSSMLTGCMVAANTAGANGGGLYFNASAAALANCTISVNAAESSGGGLYYTDTASALNACSIAGNTAEREGGGAFFVGSTPVLTNCTVTGNTASIGAGIYSILSSSLTLTSCTIAGNSVSGLYCTIASSAKLRNCVLSNRGDEIIESGGDVDAEYCCVRGGWPGQGNIDGDPLFVDPGDGHYRLRSGSACIDRATSTSAPLTDKDGRPRPSKADCVAEPGRSCWDIGAYEAPSEYEQGPARHTPSRWYVQAEGPVNGDGRSWNTAFRAITQALEVSGTSDEIWIKGGIYREAITLEPSVSVYGGFLGSELGLEARNWAANLTVIDGTGANRSTVRGAQAATLDGLSITGGNTTEGGGVYYEGVFSATLANCTIRGNTASTDGGGICLHAASPTLIRCWITSNTAGNRGGGICLMHGSPTLTDCVISGNVGDKGGAAFISGASPVLTSCTITSNSANEIGGVFCSYSSPTLIRCTISRNTTNRSGGGISCDGGSLNLTNCLITGNAAAEQGGGAYWRFSRPTLTNCTIAGNSARDGSGMYCYDSSPTLLNCILSNRGEEIALEPQDGHAVVEYCCVQGGWPGRTNIDGAPLFVDLAGGDYRLRSGSACIDRATSTGAPVIDIMGRPRPSSDDCAAEPDRSCWDIGAYEAPAEYEQGPATHSPARWYVRADGPENGDGTDWAMSFRTIAQALDLASSSDEIWVAQGTYHEAIALEPKVSLYGGFAGTETMREARNWTANPTAIDAIGTSQSTVRGYEGATLDGFAITGGNATIGGGVYFRNVSSATLANCMIAGNAAIYSGGGVGCYGSSPTLANCWIAHNTAYEHGAGVDCWDSSPALINCAITENTTNGKGAGVYCMISPPSLTNCTITDNSANSGGALFIGRQSFPTLINCIVWNEGPEFVGTGWTCTYTCVEGGAPGEGNIAPAAPSWGDDLRLLPGSPCVDAGNPASVYDDGCRPPGMGTARNDMGAFGGPGNCAWLAPAETPTAPPTESAAPTVTPLDNPTDTPLPSDTPTGTPTSTPTESPTHTPSDLPTDTPMDTLTATAPPDDSLTPTPADTDVPQPTVDPWADVNRDGWVNHEDLLIFLEHWHRSGEK